MRPLRNALLLSSFLALSVGALGCAVSPAGETGAVPADEADGADGNEVAQQDDALAAIPFVQKPRVWNLVGSSVVRGHDRLVFSVRASATTRTMRATIDGRSSSTLTAQTGKFGGSIDLRGLAVGKHELAVYTGTSKTALGRFTFYRTHPLYVFVSNDWDTSSNTDEARLLQENLHHDHPELRMTHFVGPYTFTDPTLTEAQRGLEVSWVKGMRTQYNDEIGLHIHPYCNFVTAAGVNCRTSPSFAYAAGDTTGYTVILASYTKAETSALLDKAVSLFSSHGLGRPTSFRAGGWTAESHTLQALSEHGFAVDASAANWARLEEWKDEPGASIYQWNRTHWSSINETTQPYHPNTTNMQSSNAPALSLLELPDNGALCDYVTGAEMMSMLKANWVGGALSAPTLYSIGYHPVSFGDWHTRLESALTGVDNYLASKDKGPIVYATATELAGVW